MGGKGPSCRRGAPWPVASSPSGFCSPASHTPGPSSPPAAPAPSRSDQVKEGAECRHDWSLGLWPRVVGVTLIRGRCERLAWEPQRPQAGRSPGSHQCSPSGGEPCSSSGQGRKQLPPLKPLNKGPVRGRRAGGKPISMTNHQGKAPQSGVRDLLLVRTKNTVYSGLILSN